MQLFFKNKIAWLAAMAVVGIFATAGPTLAQTDSSAAQKKATPSAPKQAATSTSKQTATTAQKLFIDVSPALVDKLNRESSSLKIMAPGLGHEIKRTRIVKVNFEALKNPQIILNLFPDAEFTATITSTSKGNPEIHEANEWLKGTVMGTSPFNRVDLSVYNNCVEGTVEMENLLFQTHFLADSTILIMEMDRAVMYHESTKSLGSKELDARR